MTVELLLAGTLVLLGTAVALLLWERRLPVRGRRVLVNLDGQEAALRGILVGRVGPWLILAEAALVQADGSAAPMDGQVLVERPRVVFLQVFPS